MEGYIDDIEIQNNVENEIETKNIDHNDINAYLDVYGEFFDQVGDFEEEDTSGSNGLYVYSGDFFKNDDTESSNLTETTKGSYYEENSQNEVSTSYFCDDPNSNSEETDQPSTGGYFGYDVQQNDEHIKSGYFGEEEDLSKDENRSSNDGYFGDNPNENKASNSSYFGEDSPNENKASNSSYFGEDSQKKIKDQKENLIIKSIATGSPLSKSGKSINWNYEFQRILDMEDSEEKYTKLSALANNFVFMAETYGKIIISELYLHNKSIKPVSIGGIAGGEKYIVQGILFKFAVDSQGIYGGDENAQKAAGHELKGLGHYWLSGVKGLNFPLMSIVNYCGFCLIAMSVLPVSKNTLQYGSADGGYTVHKDDPVLNEKMEKAAKIMNLKGHLAGIKNPKLIYGPGDIEGHKGIDGKYYVLDFARTFPPEAVLPGDKTTEKGRVLYKLLRPELVSKFRVPLSSDAFTGWGRSDPDWKIHNEEVTEATRDLFLRIIPNFVSSLTKEKIDELILELNIHGINIRHLGFIRSLLVRKESPHARIIFIEILARSLRSILTKNWRDIVRNHLLINLIALKQCACDIVNLLHSDSEEASNFWCVDIKKVLLTKYRSCLSPTEVDQTFDIRNNLSSFDKKQLCYRLFELCGIVLTKRALEDMDSCDRIYLSVWDISTIHAKVKHMHITDFADMQALFYKGLNSKNSAEAERFFTLTLEKLQKSPHISLLASEKVFEFGLILRDSIQRWEEKECVVRLGETFFTTAIRLNPSLHCQALLNIAILYEKAEHQLANKKYEELIEHFPTTENYSLYFKHILFKFNISYVRALVVKALEKFPDDPHINILACVHQLGLFERDRTHDLTNATVYLSNALSQDPEALDKYLTDDILDALSPFSFFFLIIITYEFPQAHAYIRKKIHYFDSINFGSVKTLDSKVFDPYIADDSEFYLKSIRYKNCGSIDMNMLERIIRKSHKSLNVLKLNRGPDDDFEAIIQLLLNFKSLKSLSINNIKDMNYLLNASYNLTYLNIANFELDNNRVKAISNKFQLLESFKFSKSYYSKDYDEALLKLKNLKSLHLKFDSLDDLKNVLDKYTTLEELNMSGSENMDNDDVDQFLLKYTPSQDSELHSIISSDNHPFLYLYDDVAGNILVPLQNILTVSQRNMRYKLHVNFSKLFNQKDVLTFTYNKRKMEFEFQNSNNPFNSIHIKYKNKSIGTIVHSNLNLKISSLGEEIYVFNVSSMVNVANKESFINIVPNSNVLPFRIKKRYCIQRVMVLMLGAIIGKKKI